LSDSILAKYGTSGDSLVERCLAQLFGATSEWIDLLNRAAWRFFEKAVMRLLVDVGQVCADYQDNVLRNLSTRRLQLDELWSSKKPRR
jgi:hypothetical protein